MEKDYFGVMNNTSFISIACLLLESFKFPVLQRKT